MVYNYTEVLITATQHICHTYMLSCGYKPHRIFKPLRPLVPNYITSVTRDLIVIPRLPTYSLIIWQMELHHLALPAHPFMLAVRVVTWHSARSTCGRTELRSADHIATHCRPSYRFVVTLWRSPQRHHWCYGTTHYELLYQIALVNKQSYNLSLRADVSVYR